MAVRRGAQHRQMFDRLVGWAIFAQADRIVGHHIDRWHAHQRRQPHRPARVIGKAHEGAGIGPDAAMQDHAVQGGGHPMFADAEMDIAALAVARRKYAQIGGFGVVRSGQVGGPADGFLHDRIDHLQRQFGRAARGNLGLFGTDVGLECLDRGGQFFRRIQRKGPVELVLFALGQFGKGGLPQGARPGPARAHCFPPFLDGGGNFERAAGPAIGGLGVGDQLGVSQGTVPLVGVLRR